jgi:hypothetical protein
LRIGPSAQGAIRHALTRLGELAAHPGAYGIIVLYAVLWFVLDRASLDGMALPLSPSGS